MKSLKYVVSVSVAAFALAAVAYLPPVEERCGVKVEIGSFPQKIERNNKNPFAWPLGVTEVEAGAPRAFPVTLENKTDKPVSGELEVWMNDDWDVAGPQGRGCEEGGRAAPDCDFHVQEPQRAASRAEDGAAQARSRRVQPRRRVRAHDLY